MNTITGTTDSVDRMPRLHYFKGSEAALQGMRDADCGALGFLSADAERASYYLGQDLSAWIYNNDHITDHKNNLVFLATDFRGDWFLNNTSNTYTYKKISKPTVYEELEHRFASEEFEGTLSSFIFFAHEWQFYSGTTLSSNKAWTEDACKFAADRGIAFDYPQNRTFSATDCDIDPIEPENRPQTTTRENDTLTIVDSISDMHYEAGYSISGGSVQVKPNNTGRCISKYYVLRVNGGERIKLNTTALNGNVLSYAVLEFKDIPLTNANINSKGQVWKEWRTEETYLQEDTKYILLGFKKGNGTVDFTAAELEQLRSCLDIWQFQTVNTEWTYENTQKDRAYVYVTLNAGDVVNFSDTSFWEKYKYAISTGEVITTG